VPHRAATTPAIRLRSWGGRVSHCRRQ
jgi:hypothetical protein